ncbi:MAG: hypothetical protein IKO61_08740 [Lachnospiraceae bacterium]|nr:hypothetical protein [Lachnospiraceae bacterium]
MGENRKERLLIFIESFAGISCVLQTYFGNWEFWVPIVIIIGGIGLWYIHLTQTLEYNTRNNLYFVYTAFLLLYLGVHDTSLYDIVPAMGLCMVSFTLVNRIVILNLALIEYVVIMVIQLWFLKQAGELNMDAFSVMKLVFHIGTVLVMYAFCRVTVKNKISESGVQPVLW